MRNLWNKRIYSFVILLSLTVGFVCSSILIAFLVYETSTDEFHAEGERIFQVFSDDPFKGSGRIPYIPKLFTDYMVCKNGILDLLVGAEDGHFYYLER